MLKLTNTLSGKKEVFVPLEANKVKIYYCGPTVYGFTHIGNARPALFFDVLSRYFEFMGFKVTLVSNFTDVDDKIINRAKEENVSPFDLAAKYVEEYRNDMASLSIRPPHFTPKVTEHIPQIIRFIGRLIEKNFAYVTSNGGVFFSVNKFSQYGKLSKKKIEDLISGARVEKDENKTDPLDFALWKPQKNDYEPAWESPWGKGRPGWHIECSVMAMEYLGESFDIHGGGIDLIHPHHENEIAQSEALTGKQFVKYWLHNNLLKINNEKMSKSLGNIVLTRDFVNKYPPELLKFILLSVHYRSIIDLSEERIKSALTALHRIYSTIQRCLDVDFSKLVKKDKREMELENFGENFLEKFKEYMDDDISTPKVMALFFEYIRLINAYLDKKDAQTSVSTKNILNKFFENRKIFASVLNLFGEEPSIFLSNLRQSIIAERGICVEEIIEKINLRSNARKRKDYSLSDKIRKELEEKGITLKDTPQGTRWDVAV